MIYTRLLAPIFCLFLLSLPITAQIIYVEPSGTGDGSSWASAIDLKDALTVAKADDEIWVASGTYYPSNCTDCTAIERDISFFIPDSVSLYAGFAGNEVDISQRDWENQPTILSGDIDQDGSLENNAFTIVHTRNVSEETVLDGFTITAANADSLGGYGIRQNSGGGVYNEGVLAGNRSNPVFRNCTITGNHSLAFGAGIYDNGSFSGSTSLYLNNCIISNNTSGQNGAGIYHDGAFEGSSNPIITSCMFSENISQGSGGAIYSTGNENGQNNIEISFTQFHNNEAAVYGGAMLMQSHNAINTATFEQVSFVENEASIGGALYVDGSYNGSNESDFYKCIFISNHSVSSAGALFIDGSYGGISKPTIRHCEFRMNTCDGSGGAIFNNAIEGESSPEITGCEFSENACLTYGACLFNLGKTGSSNPVITSSLFYNNEAYSAGVMYSLGSEDGESSPLLTNCTIYNNYAVHSAGAFNNNAGIPEEGGICHPTFNNCIIWGNEISDVGIGPIFKNNNAEIDINYSLVDENTCNNLNVGVGATVNCGSGMLYNISPSFIDSLANNLHLQEGSPAIDIGDNTAINTLNSYLDIDGRIRVHNGNVDMGAYEYDAPFYFSPSFLSQSENTSTCTGQNLLLEVEVSGAGLLSYQWQKDGVNINGATNSTLNLDNVSLVNAGAYTCIVTSVLSEIIISDEIDITIEQHLVSAIDITASTTIACAGEEVLFTATTENEGATPIYQWQLNGVNVGVNSNTYTNNNLNENDEITCVLQSSAACVENSILTSNMIVMNVDNNSTASVSITAPSGNSCEGEVLTFFAEIENGGSTPVYQWQINGQNVGQNSNVFSSSNLSDGDEVICLLTSSSLCLQNTVVNSNPILVNVNAPLVVEATITTSSSNICEGEETIFSILPTNEGLAPLYEWYVNGSIQGTDAIFSTTLLEEGDEVSCVLSSSETCVENSIANSNTIIMSVDETMTLEATIEANATFICEGSEVSFSVSANSSNTVYEWSVNGNLLGINNATFSTSNLLDGDIVSCMVTTNDLCFSNQSIQSNSIEINVEEFLMPTIIVEGAADVFCQGEEIVFTAMTINGGDTPFYQWQVNGIDVGSSTAIFASSNLTNNDIISCTLSSSEPCLEQTAVTSNQVIIEIQSIAMTEVAIIASTTTICEGEEISFDAIATNEGDEPIFEWQVNGMVVGTNTPVFTTTMLDDGDLVQCTVTSSSVCVSNPTAISNAMEIEVNSFLLPQVQILVAQDSICEGDEIIFAAQSTNEGGNPSYEWFVNGNAEGDNQATFMTSALNENDVVTCILSSSETCLQANQVNSEPYEVLFNCSITSNQTHFAKDFKLFPNPSNGQFTLTGDKLKDVSIIKIRDIQGKVIVEQLNAINTDQISFNVEKLNAGLYFLSLYTYENTIITKLVIN